MLKFRDTLSNQIKEFSPRKKGEASIYVCGPTVYDVPHLGHARTALTYDIISRYLSWCGMSVSLVSNITDVDDKIITKARQEKVSESDLAEKYQKIYTDQMTQLGIRPPDRQPKATEYMEQMHKVVERLFEKGFAYEIGGYGVYFDVQKFSDYGSLVHRSAQDLADSGYARIETAEGKKGPLDFALWKQAKADEPSWDSPWGKGRPGWHLECVAMSLGELGEDFDIHGGGSDLVFPHHENEKVQAEAADFKFARYWLHSAMVNVDGEKMAKSTGNFKTLADVLREHDPRTLRLAVLQTHYCSPMEINGAVLESSAGGVQRLDSFARRCQKLGFEAEPQNPESQNEHIVEFRKAMDHDFGTPQALSQIFDLVNKGNSALDADNTSSAAEFFSIFTNLLSALGLQTVLSSVSSLSEAAGDDSQIQALVQEREEARKNGDYAKADEIRDELAAQGIALEDSPTGVSWHRA